MTDRNAATTAQTPDPREVVRQVLAGLRPLVTMERDGLVLIAIAKVPDTGSIKADEPTDPGYLTFEAAAAGGLVEVTEIGHGRVPAVEAKTKDRPVVFFAGDTIVGGKQNRVVNVTVWLAAAAKTTLPVTCLEMGRWDPGSAARFGAGRKADYALRAMLSRQVAEHARARSPSELEPIARYAADQGAVWSEIDERQARAGARSRTAALHDLYASEADELADVERAFPRPDGAVGLAVAVGGRVISLELVHDPGAFATLWPRLVEGAVSAHLDFRRAIRAQLVPAPRHRFPDEGALGRLLERARVALVDATVAPSVGEGTDVRLAGPKVVGSALVRAGRLVHLELFRAEA